MWQNLSFPSIAFLSKTLRFGVLVYLFLCLAGYIWQNRLIFRPTAKLENTPEDLGLDYEEVWIPIVDRRGKRQGLHGWWIPSVEPTTETLLYLHGNGKNIGSNLGRAKRLRDLGFSVLLIDYRGYGRSRGKFPTEAQVYRDAQIAWDYLVDERDIQPQDIFIYGHSIGGAIALDLAVRKPSAAALIVEGTFTSIRDMVKYQKIYNLFPTDWLLTQHFNSLSKLRLLKVPLLVIHGKDDRVVPVRMGETLYEAAPVPKQLFLVSDAGHNNIGSVGEDEYNRRVEEFARSVRLRQRPLTGR